MATTLDKPAKRVTAHQRHAAAGQDAPLPTCPWPSCTSTPSGATRASSPPAGRSSCAPASTPAARPRTSTSSTSRDAHDNVWWGGFNTPISEERYDALRARIIDHLNAARGLRPGRLRRRRSALPPLAARLHGDGLGEHLLRQPVHPARRRRTWSASSPTSPSSTRPRFRADPERDGMRSETVILVHLATPGDPDRRHRVRRRDQEGRLRDHELPPAERGRAAHALVGQRRRGRATWPSSSASRARARRPSRPTRSGPSSATTSTAGATTACSTSRAAATPRPSACRTSTSRTSTRPRGASARSSRTSSSIPATRELDLDSEQLTENTRGRLPAALHQQQLRARAWPATHRRSSS